MAREQLHRLVLGIGNPDRGDDAAGRRVAQLLRQQQVVGVEICELDGEPSTLLNRLERASAAWIVDACRSSVPAGTMQRFDVGEAPLPRAHFGPSTHSMGLAEAIELARALGRLPRRCIVYALEGTAFELDASLSAPVAEAIPIVAARILAELHMPQPDSRAKHPAGGKLGKP
jgi:hydrogenase maturation protease